MRKLLPILILLALPFFGLSQVTTSSLTGYVKNSKGEVLSGSSVEVTHTSTGTTYRTVTHKDGRYDLVNLIPGGPYTISISFVGYNNFSQSGINLPLGENTRVDASLESTAVQLSDVVVTGTTHNTRRKTGASTNISREQINAMPTLSRSLMDFARLTPQATGSNSFAGMNNRFNNITIDGAVNNDVFGLASSGTPGGQAGTTPISLDAIQEVQVVLAPYDITYGNFTGGGINAVTRSGTNEIQGSVYYFFRNENTVGKDPLTRQKTTQFSDKQFGARIGGPIIKNKIFYFLNGEMARRTSPTLFNAGEERSLLSLEDAQALYDTVKNRWGYDAGSFGVVDVQTQSDKIFGRIDWNVTDKHRLTWRHNYINAFDDNISRSSSSFRFGNNAYRFNNKQNITVVEFRSRFSNKVTNNLIIGNHRIRDFRSVYGQAFPSIEISMNGGTVTMGSERSSVANVLNQDILEITDNLKISKGKHLFTIGTHNELFKFMNVFINNYNGRWRFASLNDFNVNAPRQFDVTYTGDKATLGDKPAAEFKAAQFGFYVQDEIQFNPKFRLTIGLRGDMPVFNDKPEYNPYVDSVFAGKYSTTTVPDKRLLFSPRIGFNYDVDGDRSTIIRGGIGVFTGRIPFVWISNQYSNNGMLTKSTSQTDNTPTQAPFTVNNGNGLDPTVEPSQIGSSTSPNFDLNLISKDFKLPQVVRFNLAADKKLPGDINLTIETILSRTLNNILYQDINLTDPVGVVDPTYNNGFDTRIAYASSSAARRRFANLNNAILISNTNRGYSFNAGFTLNKTWDNFFGQISYNFNSAADINSGLSSTALSNWEYVQVVGNPNNPPLATSAHELKHRFMGVASYNISYAKYFKSTISFIYVGSSGQPFTYLVDGDLNSDGRFGNDLMYVPADASQIKFIDRLSGSGAVIATAAEQQAAFFNFINNDKYLSSRKGNYTERNGSVTPWQHVIDMRFAQDFYTTINGKKHDLQLTIDIFNFTNLLNKKWGRQYYVSNQAYTLLTAVNRTSGPNAGKGYNYTPRTPWSESFGSRFQGQIGIRYTFN